VLNARPLLLFLILGPLLALAGGLFAQDIRISTEICPDGSQKAAGTCQAQLSGAGESNVGTTTADGVVTVVDRDDGTLYGFTEAGACSTVSVADIIACTGGTSCNSGSASQGANSLSFSGLSAGTAYCTQFVHINPTGWPSAIAQNTWSTNSTAGGAAAYDLSAYSIPFSYAWPVRPTETSTIAVDTMAEFQSAVQTAGARVEVAAGVYSGTLSSFADDVHIVMDSNAILALGGSGLDFSDVNRLHWEGGIIDGGDIATSGSDLTFNDGNSDILFDSVYLRDMADGWILLGDTARFAIVNSTCRAFHYCVFTYPGDDTSQPGQSFHEDLVVAGNDLFGGMIDGSEATSRFMNVRQHVFAENRVRNLDKHLHRVHFSSQYVYVAGNQFEPTVQVVMWTEHTDTSGAGAADHGPMGYLWYVDNEIHFPDGGSFVAEIQLGGLGPDFDFPAYVEGNTGFWDQGGSFTVSSDNTNWSDEGGNSRTQQSFAPPAFGGGATHAYLPYDLTDRPFAFLHRWPIPPSTSSTINVTAGSFAELQTAVSTDGALVNVPAGTYTGDLDIDAGDLDVVCAAGAEINGTFTLGSVSTTSAQRIRITGCDFNTQRPVFEWARDVLLDNVRILNDVDGVSTNVVLMNGGTTVDTRGIHRFASVNSTFKSIDGGDSGGLNRDSFAIFFLGHTGIEWFDFTFANTAFVGPNFIDGGQGAQTTRFQRMLRMVLVESLVNPPNSAGSFNTTGLRVTTASEDVYIADTHSLGNYLLNLEAPAANCIDCVHENLTLYGGAGARCASQIQSGETAANTGTWQDSFVYSTSQTAGTECDASPMTSLGNNLFQSWDGSTVPQADSDGVTPDFDSYGAIRDGSGI
jgi:hypothetical protein